ncbi:MAG: VCBS repeat-containing protein [Planctomycetes bacterium]|nr:VCBS repeat-containing protein [Planctomycetota bacterium]
MRLSHFGYPWLLVVLVMGALGVGGYLAFGPGPKQPETLAYKPRQGIETSGFLAVFNSIERWRPDASLDDYAKAYRQAIPRGLALMDKSLESDLHPMIQVMLQKASLYHAKGDPASAHKTLEDVETHIRGTGLEADWLYTVIFYKGMTALRMAENDNCVMCRGESSCIFPINPAAVHTNPTGSRLAVRHFTEYLRRFPDDLEVKWLLNLAHMTLGEHPDKVNPRHRLLFDAFGKSEFDIGQFRDVGHLVGVNRLNQSGGAIMEDFDNDGLLDLVVTSWAPDEPMAYYRNKGDGTFENRTKAARLDKQMGGLYCVQADYNNDGHMDIFIPRGSWLPLHLAQRPSLLRNNGDGTFTDVTAQAGLLTPTNSTSACWADFDNDGFLDLFLCCQRQPCLLYRNKGDGTFEELATRAGLPADLTGCLGATWIDFDNDGFPDLFVNIETGPARLFRNKRNGSFSEVTREMNIDGPTNGFSCWAFDFDNDGYLDIFATTFSHSLEDIVKGMMNQPHNQPTAKLYRNLQGKGFQDVTKEAGLDKVFAPMGSNFGDLDNDGYLDFYLGTGAPGLSVLVPNRLFKNVEGKRFAEITASSRTGHLQKGHGVAIGDWDRNGTADLFIQLGGAVAGDSYHNVLFQNPGQGNNWLSVKLIGKKTNRAAIGARIKVVAAGPEPLTVQRDVSSGSSFGANPLEQHIGLGKAKTVARLEIHWPTSGTPQVFRDVAVNQGIVVTEFAKDYQRRSWKAIPLPK